MWRCVVAILLASVAVFAQANEIKPDHRHTLLTLLASENPADWQTAEEVVRMQNFTDQYALDLMAERLHSDLVREQEKKYFVPLARFARALGDSGQVRFRPLLQDTLAKVASPKMRQYVEKALKALPKSDAPGFVPISMDWRSLSEQLEAVALHDRSKQREPMRVLPEVGASMDSVYAQLGLPDHVKALTIPLTRLGNIKAFYYGLGIVQFDFADRDSIELTVSEVMPETSNMALQYQGPNKPLAHAINAAHDKYMRYLVKGGWRTLQTDPELIPVLYDKLLLMAPTSNEYGEDAIAHALKALNKLQAPGFDGLLAGIVARAPDSEAADYARAWQKRRIGAPAQQPWTPESHPAEDAEDGADSDVIDV